MNKKAEDKPQAAAHVRRTGKTAIASQDLSTKELKHAKKARRSSPETCPVCAAPVPVTAKGGRRMHHCVACGATQRPDLTCDHCSTNRIWEGKGGAFCQGCGHEAEWYGVEITG